MTAAMSLMSLIFLFTPAVYSATPVEHSQAPECIHGSNKDLTYVKELETNSDPLTVDFRNTKPETFVCNEVQKNPLTEAKQQISEVLNHSTPKSPQLSLACIEASSKREISGKRLICGQQRRYLSALLNIGKTPCVSKSMVEYVHFSVNKALSCMSDLYEIDPLQVLRLFNNETGFQYYFASTNGKGMGQMTMLAIDDLTKTERGQQIMKYFLDSPHPDCAPFQKILADEINNPKLLGNEDNCKWAASGAAFARNLIYSMAYVQNLNINYIDESVTKYDPRKNSELKRMILTMSYGPSGPQGALSILHKYRGNPTQILAASKICPGTNAACNALTAGEKDALGYLQASNKKLDEMTNLLPAEKQGQSCIE